MFSRILLATDGSKGAMKAAEAATQLASKFCSRLCILAVYHPVPVISVTGDGAYEIEPGHVGEILDHTLASTSKVPQGANVDFTLRKVIGYPVEEIVRVAKEESCDLIVLGSRGLGGFQSILLGSVSDRVIHTAHCPVMVIR